MSWSRSKDADHEALEQGAVSLTPIHLDTTHHGVLDRFRKWETVRRHSCAAGSAASIEAERQAEEHGVVGNLIEAIITELSRFVVSMISTFGYTGIFITMAIESACIPLPSEIIMPFSGYLVTTGQFTMLGVTLAGAVGNVLGVACGLLCRGVGRPAFCRAIWTLCVGVAERY